MSLSIGYHKGMRLFFAILLICFAAGSAGASSFEPAMGLRTQNLMPAKIAVKKSERSMRLLDMQGNVIKTYKVALGKNPVGNKQQEGDNRTPEGSYYIDARNENSDYFLSLRLSYPSPQQRALASQQGVRPGGNIFIHGMPNGKEWMRWKYNLNKDWTNGCIALTNRDMKEIWDLVADGTPIVIEP